MREIIFDINKYSKNDIINELIFLKTIYGEDVFTWYNNTYFDTTNLKLLNLLKDNEKNIKKLSVEEVKMLAPKEVFQMLNKTKLSLEPIVGEGLEKYCINILCEDISLALTIRLTCYLLYMIQLGKSIDDKLDEIMYNYKDEFNIYVCKSIILKYTDKRKYAKKVFNRFIYETEYFNELIKIKKINNKIEN